MWTLIGRVALTGLVLSGIARSLQPGGLFPPDGVVGPPMDVAAPSNTVPRSSSTTTTATTTTAPATVPAEAPTTTAAPAAPSSAWPTPATTGATSAESELAVSTDCRIDAGEVVEGVSLTCTEGLVIGTGATLRNAVVRSNADTAIQAFEEGSGPARIEDVTVLRSSGCSGEAIGWSEFEAIRVEVLGFRDSFVNSNGDNAVIRDSYIKLCTGSDGWGAGLSGYPGGSGVVLDHNTIDARCHDWTTAIADAFHPGSGNPDDRACNALSTVFWNENSTAGVTITDNLLRGGAYAFRILGGSGHSVTGNVVERNSYAYGPVFECVGVAAWSGNREADVSASGAVSNEVPFECDPAMAQPGG